MLEYTEIFNKEEIYNDFVKIYEITSKKLDYRVVLDIKNISNKYGQYKEDIFRIFSILYMAMIAEENKRNTKLGKRIKRLGVYYLLIKGYSPEYSANFMNRKEWQVIDKWCLEGGF